MAERHGRVRRGLIRVITDDNLDLYALGAAALVFTVLGITGITDVKTTSAVVVALLALLAFSQIKSRRAIEQIRAESRGGAAALFAPDFPADLAARRAQARDVLLIGHSISRTVQSMRSDMVSILNSGGRVRVLVLDPTDETILRAANHRMPDIVEPNHLRSRVMATLDELTSVRVRAGGRLEVRVFSSILSAGFVCLDATTPQGLVVVQYYEFRNVHESAPIFTLERSDGAWYHHFVDEAERLWDAGTDWPLSPEARAARARKPAFTEEFGPDLDTAVESTTDLLVTGVSRNIFVNNHYRRLEKKLLAGHRVRFLLVAPTSPAITMAAERYYPERKPESNQDRVEHTLRLLAELKSTTGGDLSVRLTTHLISMFQIVTDTALFAEYYVYKDLAKPKFVLAAGDGAYRDFRAEAENMWEHAAPYEW